jgi:Kdo2-lipid IVA lauroyltransferase/acyltransferase
MAFENYQLYRVAIWLVRRLPRGFLYFVAGVIAELNFAANRTGRLGVYANLDHVLGTRISRFTRWRYGRSAFRHFAYSVIDIFLIPGLTLENLNQYVAAINGMEVIEACRSAGKGGIFMTAHMGSWELAGAAVGLLGVPVTAAVLKHADPRIDAIFASIRRRGQIEEVPLGGALSKLESAVQRGRFIALVSDRDVKGTGMKVRFFGEETTLPTGHATLAAHTGAWIIPGLTYRTHDHRIVMEIRQPIIPQPGETEEELMARSVPELERIILEHPDQWSSFFDLWSKTRRPVLWQHMKNLRRRAGS